MKIINNIINRVIDVGFLREKKYNFLKYKDKLSIVWFMKFIKDEKRVMLFSSLFNLIQLSLILFSYIGIILFPIYLSLLVISIIYPNFNRNVEWVSLFFGSVMLMIITSGLVFLTFNIFLYSFNILDFNIYVNYSLSYVISIFISNIPLFILNIVSQSFDHNISKSELRELRFDELLKNKNKYR